MGKKYGAKWLRNSQNKKEREEREKREREERVNKNFGPKLKERANAAKLSNARKKSPLSGDI